MPEERAKYERSLEDELDWSLLEQLHRATLQTGTFCFRTKQIYVTVEIAVLGLLARFLGDKLDHSVFVAGLLIALVFWFLDSTGYYYQVKLRIVMDEVRTRLLERNRQGVISSGGAQKVIEESRSSESGTRRFREALVNHSMWLYLIIAIIDVVFWVAFSGGLIQ